MHKSTLPDLDFKIGQILPTKDSYKIHSRIKYDSPFQDHYRDNIFEKWEFFEIFHTAYLVLTHLI